LGIKPAVAAAIQTAFPNIRFPTESQIKFIPAIIAGYDVLLKDDTGTGKYVVADITKILSVISTMDHDRSLGLVFALLNKPHLQSLDFSTGKPIQRPRITSLVIVPHRDLAHQFHYWITCMTAAPTVYSPPPLSNVCQVLVREGTTPLSSRISMLRENPPHILIGTPKALLEVLNTDRDALQLESLSTVVVDEVDYLIESVPRKDSKKMMDKARRKLDRHPSPTRQLLDVIYASRRRANEGVMDYTGKSQSQQDTWLVRR
jgi:superfamily II DNA/RNA helicase